MRSASRSGVRLTPSSSASATCDIVSPGVSDPSRIDSRIMRWTCSTLWREGAASLMRRSGRWRVLDAQMHSTSRLKVRCAHMLAGPAGAPACEMHALAERVRSRAMADRPLVTLADGAVRGIATAHGDAFLGIPYARAGRLAAPSAVAGWGGERDAAHFGPVAPQPVRPIG